mmetsp:Transcript_13922/g.40728  ORF Transcript_13922/g.40728 Transcript_13922/m.40728 type:complete len:90 (+) Transcript_13922:1722-1991(+)
MRIGIHSLVVFESSLPRHIIFALMIVAYGTNDVSVKSSLFMRKGWRVPHHLMQYSVKSFLFTQRVAFPPPFNSVLPNDENVAKHNKMYK